VLKLPTASRTLLRTIADNDDGHGVRFHHAPYGRWRLDGTQHVVNDRTFFPLHTHGFIDIGNGHTDPVRITDAGRTFLEGRTR
jgi:hypothetical protein